MSSTPSLSRFEYVFWVPLDPSAAFRFFSDPANLDRVTPRWFRLKMQTAPPEPLAEGSAIDYRFRWRCLTFRWRSVITLWEPPHRFTYEQERGPYRAFVHEHDFGAERGGTRVTDRVLYRAPGGPLVGRWIVEPDLQRIFSHRRTVVAELNARRGPLSEISSNLSTIRKIARAGFPESTGQG